MISFGNSRIQEANSILDSCSLASNGLSTDADLIREKIVLLESSLKTLRDFNTLMKGGYASKITELKQQYKKLEMLRMKGHEALLRTSIQLFL